MTFCFRRLCPNKVVNAKCISQKAIDLIYENYGKPSVCLDQLVLVQLFNSFKSTVLSRC